MLHKWKYWEVQNQINRKWKRIGKKKESLFRFSPYCPNHILSFKYSTPHCLLLWIYFTYSLSVSHSLSVCCRLLYTLNINHRHNNNSTKPEPKADHRIHNPLELPSLRFLRSLTHTLSLSLSSDQLLLLLCIFLITLFWLIFLLLLYNNSG